MHHKRSRDLIPRRAINHAADKVRGMGRVRRKWTQGFIRLFSEPSAAADLVQQLIFSLNAREAEEGRSAFSRANGGTALGEQVLNEKVHISSEPESPARLIGSIMVRAVLRQSRSIG